MKWHDAARMIVHSGMDIHIDWESEFFICPECGEPILADDFPEISIMEDQSEIALICPVCGERIN